jgi:DNA polymerase-3 subunit delta'
MMLRPIYGHETLMDRLGGTLASGRFPQTALFVGKPGTGKQRLALWVAQGLLCHEGPGVPCDRCPACRSVLGLQHPDLNWFVPIPRPKAQDPDKLVEEARLALGEVMEERRQNPLWKRPDGMASHSLASARLLHRLVWVTPFAGSRKVFIIGDAERLIVQESSPEAANALLKVLEEPPADTTVILTASDPGSLLPTIRSRLVTVRVPPVSEEAVRQFLQTELDPPPDREALERLTVLADGSIGQALWASGSSGNEPDRAAQDLLEALRAGPEAWLPSVLAQRPWAARGDFTATLDALAVRLRAELRSASDRDPAGDTVRRRVAALERVEAARAAAQGNVNPQLALAVLAGELGELL